MPIEPIFAGRVFLECLHWKAFALKRLIPLDLKVNFSIWSSGVKRASILALGTKPYLAYNLAYNLQRIEIRDILQERF